MKIKMALAAALLGCQLFCPLAQARSAADQKIDSLLQNPLQSIAQSESAVVPNGQPYVPPVDSEASGTSSLDHKSGRRGRRAGGASSGRKRPGKGHHKRTLSSTKRRSQTASAGEPSCCAPASEM